MARVHTFNVTPSLPDKLRPLEALAYDLTWSWTPDARALFRRMDSRLWEEVNGNPVALLGRLDQARLDQLQDDEAFLTHMQRVADHTRAELERTTWFERHHGELTRDGKLQVAYFSAEYGLTEALPIYSGGLGVLSGDHLKSSHGVGVPLVAVGLAYQEGYFRQYLNEDGWQQEDPYDNDFTNLPMRRARLQDGSQASIHVEIEGRPVKVRIWEVRIGRTRLYLLDTNSPSNAPEDRVITNQLYGGGTELRFKQEIVLGIGGLRALMHLGHAPTVFHMNEGHSAFMALERIRMVVERTGLPFSVAHEVCSASHVFTTHTPVPAGFDIFSVEQLDRFLPRLHEQLGISRRDFLALGAHEGDPELRGGFNMAYLALRCAEHINGVSQLHGEVSRAMWTRLWPGHEPHEVPIGAVTNGIHVRTWTSAEMGALLDRYLGERWATDTANPNVWQAVETIPDAELWRTHERRRERLVTFVRQRVKRQLKRKGRPEDEIAEASELLDPHVLTIGFARRFATYKRANLLLRQPDRLRALLCDPERPVQIIFAGKAHPKDVPGKELIREIVHFARDPMIRRRIVFLEEYDMGVARRLVQGVDVWLNNPRRPKEASGTSGMKVLSNGGLNLSVLDGWWAEAYDGTNGWAIGAGETYEDVDRGDAIEADLLLDLVENQIVPEFYDRSADRLPRKWLRRMKRSMRDLTAVFSTDRMLQDYAEQLYLPASEAHQRLAADDFREARERARRAEALRHTWGHVHIGDVHVGGPRDLPLGSEVTVETSIYLGSLAPEDVNVEIYGGLVDGSRRIVGGTHAPMTPKAPPSDGWYRYHGTWTPRAAGHNGFTVRVRPAFASAAPVRGFGVKAWE